MLNQMYLWSNNIEHTCGIIKFICKCLCDSWFYASFQVYSMWPCHQSRFVIDHCVAITASFDEHGLIRNSLLERTSSLAAATSRFSGLACQSGREMSIRLHITATLMWSVYGDRCVLGREVFCQSVAHS